MLHIVCVALREALHLGRQKKPPAFEIGFVNHGRQNAFNALLHGAIKYGCGLEDGRRAAKMRAIMLPAHRDEVARERRQAACDIDLETEAAVTDRRALQIRAMTRCKDARYDLIVHSNDERNRNIRCARILRPACDAFPRGNLQIAAERHETPLCVL